MVMLQATFSHVRQVLTLGLQYTVWVWPKVLLNSVATCTKECEGAD